MKCISIRQPWAWLIVRPDLAGKERTQAVMDNIIKAIENRTWSTRYRGPVLIHAAKGMTRQEYADVADHYLRVFFPRVELPAFDALERGGIVGQASLDDCVPWADATNAWHQRGCYGFVLNNSEPLPFHPMKGSLGLFDVPWPPASEGGSAA